MLGLLLRVDHAGSRKKVNRIIAIKFGKLLLDLVQKGSKAHEYSLTAKYNVLELLGVA